MIYELSDGEKFEIKRGDVVVELPVNESGEIVVNQGGGSISDNCKIPFLVYLDKEGEGGQYIYLPAGSLFIDGREVIFDGVEDGKVPVEDNTSYWCEIFRMMDKETVGHGDDSDSDSEESEVPVKKDLINVYYKAQISDEEEPSDGVVFRFKITDVLEDKKCDQKVCGSVHLGKLPDYTSLVPWQVVQIDYSDEKSDKTLYRMFLPDNGTITYNGFTLRIKESEGGWYEMKEPIGTEDATYRYYCVIYNLSAHLFTEDEYHDFLAGHLSEQSNIQAKFLAVEVKSGDGGETPPVEDWANKTVKALIVTTENGYIYGQPHSRPGANAEFGMWSSIFGCMTTADNILHLADSQATQPAISEALDIVCDTAGLTIFEISTHGGEHGEMEIYNDLLQPATLAAKFAQSPGPVWFIADCCYSGMAVNKAAPPSEALSASNLVRDVGAYLRKYAPNVKYLGWACTQPDKFGWTNEDGALFTVSCFRNIVAGKTFAEVWDAVSTDQSVTYLEIPTKVVANGFEEDKPIIKVISGL